MKNIIIILVLTFFLPLMSANQVFCTEKFTKADWEEMNRNIQQLKDNFNNLKSKVDINTSRKIILQQAKNNPVFTGANLYQDTISLEYKGRIPVILDLPGPNSHLYE